MMSDNYHLDFSGDHYQPLAARMRPSTLADYIGQAHLLADGRPLRQALEAGQLHSMILWGPAGTGKTSLAEIAAHYAKAHVLRLSAVNSGVKEIRAALNEAGSNQSAGQQTILFIDEVHRFNKSQQDAFLPYIEDGTVIFIGATTENPSFELNNALLSRARVYRLLSLTEAEVVSVLQQAMQDEQRGLGKLKAVVPDELLALLAGSVQGDARMALNHLELLYDLAPQDAQGVRLLNEELVEQLIGGKTARFDRQGDRWYDLISALHKSIRGSNPDAALYWAARIITAGGDPLYIARRLLAIASEDIGNADPKAMQVALNAWDCFERVGPAEGERAIAQAVVYLACAPKSNAVYLAWQQALQHAKELPDYDVPMHLRNAPTQLMQQMGYGAQYRYAHDEPGAYAAGESYFPEALDGTKYYHPSNRGFEVKITDKLAYLAQLDSQQGYKRYEDKSG